MQKLDDISLLREYTERHSDAAFGVLVERHIDRVYSVALRHTRNPHAAEEVTQAVFVILARKAAGLGKKVIFEGWLYQTTRLTALTFIRGEIRRARREQEAHMQTVLNENESETWAQIAPELDAALAELNSTDRNAVVLRFFYGKSLEEVGAGLGTTGEGARKRVDRALEKLERHLHKRGITSTAETITGAISTYSVHSAPVTLAKSATAMALTKGATASTSTLVLIKGALKVMAWSKLNVAIVTTAVVILAAGTATVAVKEFGSKTDQVLARKSYVTGSPIDTYLLKADLGSSEALQKAPPVLSVQETHFPKRNGGSIWFDLPDTNAVQAIGRVMTLDTVMQAAYGFNKPHMILPKPLPDTNYDFMATLPHCSRKAFQDEIEKDISYRAHAEVLPTDVFLLRVKNADAPGLVSSTTKSDGIRLSWGDGVYNVTNMPISDLANFLENNPLKQPVIDKTGLRGTYNINIKWEPHDMDALKQILLDQLGLEIVPTNMPVEMLVVEKVN